MSTSVTAPIGSLDDAQFEAILEASFLVACADDEFGEEEQRSFMNIVESLTDRRMSRTAFSTLIARFQQGLCDEGRDARLAAIKARLAMRATRMAALSIAIQMMASDGILRSAERTLVFELADALDIERDTAADLMASLTPAQ